MEVHWRNLGELPEEVREKAVDRLQSLAEGHTDLVDAWINAKTTDHHRHGGQEVRITCQARGKEIVAARTRPDLAEALNEALDAFEREVRRMRDRRTQRRAESPPTAPELGVIDQVFEDEGYGFILTDSGDRVYFHRNAVREELGFAALTEGQRVGLNIEAGEKGLQATVVMPPPAGTPAP